ncbi:MAG: cell division protein FtsA [Chlorobi bacterium]|nr:cell division protein FtsA [Chlorobiota bacterium]
MNKDQPTRPLKVALDIGTTKVVAVAGRLNKFGKIEVEGYTKLINTGVVQGEIFNMLDTTATIKHVMEDLKLRFDINEPKVSVGLSGGHIRMHTLTEYITHPDFHTVFTEEDLKKLMEKVKNNALGDDQMEVLEIIPQYFLLDGMRTVSNPVGVAGKRLEGTFVVVTGNRSKIDKIRESVKKAGYEVENFYLQSIASAEAILTPLHKQAGAIVIDMGGGTSDIVVVRDGIYRYAGVVNMGGDLITEEIAATLQLVPHVAERFKLQNGSALGQYINREIKTYRLNLDNDMETLEVDAELFNRSIDEALEFIVTGIKQHLRYFRRNNPGESQVTGLFLTGGGAQLRNLPQYFAGKLGLNNVKIGQPATHLAPGPFTSHLSAPMYATVVGMLKLSLEEAENPSGPGSEEKPEKSASENKDTPLRVEEVRKQPSATEEKVKKSLLEGGSFDPAETREEGGLWYSFKARLNRLKDTIVSSK